MGMTGLITFTLANLYCKRFVRKVYLHESGNRSRIVFFNAFGTEKVSEFHPKDFNILSPSYSGFYKSEVTTIGNIWISLGDNEFRDLEAYHNLAIRLLDG